MTTKAYSPEFREAMLRRMMGPEGIRATSLAREVGVSQSTLSRWLRRALDPQRETPMSTHSPEDKMRLVLQTASLPDEDLGAFLRTHGLHQADLDAWKAQMLTGLDPAAQRQQRQQQRQELRDAQARTTQLEKELRRKDAALAETAALLVLKKKSNRSGGTRTTTPERSAPARSLTAR